MKEIEFEHPNKMRFESGFKTFDKQTNLISTGNLISNTQYSRYIRPRTETICCYDEKYPIGHLQNYDLKSFQKLLILVKCHIHQGQFYHEHSSWLYEFHHISSKHKIVDGYAITDCGHKNILKAWYRNWFKSCRAVDEALKYIAHDPKPQSVFVF